MPENLKDLLLGQQPKANNTTEPTLRDLLKQQLIKPASTDIQLGKYGVGESKYDTGITPENVGQLGEIRGQRQSSLSKIGAGLANAVTQTGIDIIKDTSYLLDYENLTNFKKSSEEGFQNWLATSLQSIEDKIKLPVYRTKASEGFSPTSAGWWGENLPSIVSTISMMIPAQGAVMGLSKIGKLMGGDKLIRGIEGVSGITGLDAAMKGVTGAVISRQMENLMEGGQTFQDTYQEALKHGKTENEAKQIAGEAAANNYKLNWANLATDIPQYLLLNKSFKQSIKDQQIKFADLAKTMVQEGSEEAYQFISNEETKRAALIKSGILNDDRSDIVDRLANYSKDGDFWTSAFLGALGGGIFTGAAKLKNDRNIGKMNDQYETLAKLHTSLIKNDEQSFNRTSDDLFSNELTNSIKEGTIDQFKSALERTYEVPEEANNRIESSKRISERKNIIKFAEDYKNNLSSDETKSPELKALELNTVIEQKLASKRLQSINSKITNLQAEDISILQLQDPSLYQFKLAKLRLEAIKGEDIFNKETKELEKTIESSYKELLDSKQFSSKEEIDQTLSSANDNELITLLHNRELDNKRLSNSRQILNKISNEEGRKEYQDLIDKLKKEQVKHEKKAEEEQTKKEKGEEIPSEIAKKDTDPFHLVLHGETKDSDKGLSRTDDSELTEEGINEAIENKTRLQGKLNTVVSSPLDRAQHTANILTDGKGHDTHNNLRTWEIGNLKGKPESQFDEKYFVENPDEVVGETGESFNQFKKRTIDAFKELANTTKGSTAIVIHSKVESIIKAWEKAGRDGYNIDNSTYLNYKEDRSKPTTMKRGDFRSNPKANIEVETKQDIDLNIQDGLVPDLDKKTRNKIEEELKDSLKFITDEDKEYTPQGKVITLGDLIIPAAHSIAYLSKDYIKSIATIGDKTYQKFEDIGISLNEKMQEPMLLSSTKYQVNDNLFIEIDTAFNLVLENKTTLTYEQHKNDALRVPMKITNEEGKTIGYLHDIDWVNEVHVVSKDNNIEEQRKQLTQLRYSIFENGRKEVKINSKSYGKLDTINEDKPTSELIKSKYTKFAIGKNNQYWTALEEVINGEQPINSSIQSGLTYMIVNTPVEGKTIALPLFNTKVDETTIDTLVNAAEVFFAQNKTIADEVLNHTSYDILTTKGLRDFFNLFVSTNSFDQADLNANVGRDDKLFLDILGSGIKYGTGGNILTEVGNAEHWNKEEFKYNIKNAYNSVFLKHLEKDSFKTVIIDNEGKVIPKESTYSEYIKSITTTNIIEHELPDGSYTYFVQPVITFTENIDEEEAIATLKTTEIINPFSNYQISEEDNEIPNELGSINLDDIELEDSEDLLPPKLDNNQIANIIKDSSLINGFNAYQQAQVINIMNSYILKQLKENGSQSKEILYNNLKSIFNKYSKYYTNVKPTLGNEFKKIIDNFDSFRTQAEQRLLMFNVKETSVEGLIGIEDLESTNEKTNFDDGATFQIDPKDGMSGRLKQFLSFIPNPKKSYIGLDSYMSYDEVVNYLSGQLAGLDADYTDISSKLDELIPNHEWIKSVKILLDDSSESTKNEFVQWATKHYTGFKIIELKGKTGTAHTIKVMDSDQNSITKIILTKWLTNMKVSFLVKESKPGELVIDNEQRDKLVQEFKNTSINDLEAIREWLNKIGINVSKKTLEAIKSSKRKPWEKQFTEAGGIFRTIIDKISKKSINEDDSFESNNPLLENSGVRSLAYYETQNSEIYYSNSFKSGEGKTIYSYSANKYFIKQFYKLKNNKNNYLQNLLKVSFSSTSQWAKKLTNPNSYFREVFDYFYTDTLKVGNKAVTLDKMSSREHEIAKLGLFQNQNNGSKEKGLISHFLFPTMSDKSTMTGITTLRHETKINFNEDKSFNIGSESINAIYDIVDAEYTRIRSSYNIKNNVDSYNPNKFYFFEELNDNDILWDIDGNKKTLKPLNDTIKEEIKSKLKEHLINLIESKKEHWKSLGITNENGFEHFDKSYVTSVNSLLSKTNKTNDNIITYAASDFVINYLIANTNIFQLFIGDPAQFWKKNLENTWINIGKRLAGEIAPGLELADSKNNKFRVAFLKDAYGVLAISKNYEQIVRLIGKEAAEPYRQIEGTDAQEWTTLAEHLYILVKSGRLEQEKANKLLTKEEKGILSNDDYTTIFQPLKPVYVNTQIDKSLDINRKIYIKSSSFPLIKGLSPELDNLRNSMLKHKIDRLAFKTATKVGGPSEYIDIFDKDGNILKDIDLSTNALELSREGFRIQQDVPFDIDKQEINRGTQESKLLFANILDINNFQYKEEELNGNQLYEKYNELNKELFETAKNKLLNELVTKEGQLNLVKVQDMLIKEASGRGWPQNDINALKLIQKNEFEQAFALPLWSSTSSSKIEALLNSLVDNRVRKQKFRGNSFVLGSEEGFKGSSKSIIFTKNYDPKQGLLPQRLDTYGKILPAQVLISNKLRDSENNLINLPIDKDGLLDISKVDPEILKLFGFRIPTQGHSSMSYIEIVGFLPSYMGDLIIAPKDFTKQMGSDFDIDKLYTYFYETETNEDDLLTKKTSVKNSILDIHLSVMQNSQVLKHILNPLGFGKLPELAVRVDKARNERKETSFKPTRLSDTYQKEKYLKARGGKSGTGVKSLDSVFTAISQNKNLYLRTTKQEKDQTIEIPLNLVFGDIKGNSIELNDISNTKSINKDPKIYTVAAYQSAAVDNEKEQILEKINSNNYTFDAERALAAVGFTEEFIVPLTSQDIIFEYTDLMSKTQDSVNDEFISNPELTIVEQLIEKYSKLGGLSKDLISTLRDADHPVTQEELWNSIEFGNKDSEYFKTQIRSLVKFNKARQIGKEISNIQLSINTDSSGISPSIIESTYKEVKVNNLKDNEFIANAVNLLDNTINGYATENALKVANSLWSEQFPYSKDRVIQSFDEIQKVTGKKILTNEDRIKLFNDMKSFIYSKQDLGLDNTNVTDLRQKLFFDNKENKSLATKVRELQKTSKNPFIIRLVSEPDITGYKPSLIKYNAGASENFDEVSVYQGFTDLMISESTREIAQDLITYFYLSGGIQQAIQFGKYIPISYLTNIPFAEKLRELNFNDETLLGINDYKHNYYEVSNFTKQWLQHNPSQAIKIKEDLSQVKWIGSDLENERKGLSSIPIRFSTDNELFKDLLTLKTNPQTGERFQGFPEFVSLYDNAVQKKFRLYEYIGEGKYVQINTLGTFGYSEYNQNQSNISSLIKDNQTKTKLTSQTPTTDNRDNLEVNKESEVENNQPKVDRIESYKLNDNDIKTTLDIISKSSNESSAELAKYLLSINNQSPITIKVVKNEFIRGSYNYSNHTLKINPKFIQSDIEMEKIILHEYIHHLTGYTLNSKNRTKEQEKVVQSLTLLQKKLQDRINSSPKAKAEYDKFIKAYLAKQSVDESHLSRYYGAYSINEFVTMTMTDTTFQRILNDIPFNESKSMLDRFMNIITKLLNTLGFPIKENSLLEYAIHDTINLISLNNPNIAENIVEDHLPIGSDSERKAVRDKIRRDILDIINVDNTSAYSIEAKPNSIMLPINTNNKSLTTKANTYNWAKSAKKQIDKVFNTKIYGELVEIDTTNPKGTIIHILHPSALIDNKLKDEDYAPITSKSNIVKYQREIDNIQDRINFIKKRIASNKSNRELVSDLSAKVKTLEDRIEQIQSEDKLADIINYGNTDMKELTTLLTKDKVNDTDLFYSNKILHQWETALSSIFSENDLRQIDGIYSPNVQAIQSIITQAQVLRNKYNKVFDNAVFEMFKSQGINATKEQIFAAKKEIGTLSASLMDISRTGDILLDAVSKIMKDAAFETEQELIKINKEVDKLFEKVSKTSLFKSKGFNIFAQESKDGKTGNLVSRYSQSYYDKANELRKEARDTGDWNTYFKWKRDNSIVFDLRKIFYDEYKASGGLKEYSQETITAHINDLKAQLGERGYQEYNSRLKEKFELYKEDLQANKDRIEALEADSSEKEALLKKWILENSPYVYADYVVDNIKPKLGKKIINPKGYKYTSEVPRKYTQSLKKTNWYDEKFEQIESNDDLYNFYNYVIDKYNELYDYMPDYVVDNLQHNYLPEIHKNIIEQFSDKGLTKGLTGWYDKVVNTLTTNDISSVSYAERDPRTGEIIRSLPITMLGQNLSAQDKSYDLVKITKAFSVMGLSYKHKSKVEDSIRLAEQVMNQSLERQENAEGEHLVDAQGRTISTSNGLKNLKSQFDYAIEAGFYGKRKDTEMVSKKKLLTTDEKKTKKEINAKLKDPKTTEEEKTILKTELEALGANIVGSSVWDNLLKFVQLKGMGWNLFAPSNNVVFAFVSNAIHASGGEDFNLNDFFWAQSTMLNSVGKSVSLDTIKTKTANKISALMELYNVVGEIDQAAYKATAFNSGLAKGINKLAPLELTKRAEYLNQGVTFLALMKATKITDLKGNEDRNLWEAYDEKGKWKTSEFGEQPEWNSTKEKMKTFKYKLEQIKKTVHGNYDPNSPVKIKKTVLGRALIMFRSWVAEGFASRFEGEKYDEFLQRSRKGRLRTYNPITGGDLGHLQGARLLLSQMANFLTFGTMFKSSLDQLSPIDKANMRKNAAEVMIYASLYLMILAMKHAGSDDDKEKKSLNALINVGFRVQNDMAFFTSPLAFEKITQSSIPAMTIITDAAKFVKACEETIAGNGIYKRGIYRGQSKIKISLARQFPGTTQILRTTSGILVEPNQ